MATFTVNIKLGDDAMRTPEDVADALEKTASRVRAGAIFGKVMDANGNSCGTFSGDFETDED